MHPPVPVRVIRIPERLPDIQRGIPRLFAVADSGLSPTIRGRYHDARRVLDQLATAGVDFDDVTRQLEREGLAKFEKSWHELSHTIAAELRRNHPARQS